MPVILFATHNPWKGLQFQPTFEQHGFTMLTLIDALNGEPGLQVRRWGVMGQLNFQEPFTRQVIQ